MANDLFEDISKILNNMGNRTKELVNELTFLNGVINQWDASLLAEKSAYLMALDELSKNAFEILKLYTLQACIASEEYNYEPYINHLMGAVQLNENEIIKLKPINTSRPSEIIIDIDFSPLGLIDEWAYATDAARKALDVGKSPIGAASKMWAEKIYGAGREGKSVTRRTKNGNIDVTEKYAEKYESTVLMRLAYLEDNKAPFWYLIEHGNISTPMSRGGDPYPIVKPQNFTVAIEKILRTEFVLLFNLYKIEAKKLVDEFFKVNTIEPQVVKEMNLLVGGIKSGKVDYKKMGQKAQVIIKEINIIYEIFTMPTTGNVFARIKGTKGRITGLLKL